MIELRVSNNPKQAAEHEEFIANLNKKVFMLEVVNRASFYSFKYVSVEQKGGFYDFNAFS